MPLPPPPLTHPGACSPEGPLLPPQLPLQIHRTCLSWPVPHAICPVGLLPRKDCVLINLSMPLLENTTYLGRCFPHQVHHPSPRSQSDLYKFGICCLVQLEGNRYGSRNSMEFAMTLLQGTYRHQLDRSGSKQSNCQACCVTHRE